jgi:polyketide biosynthesis 3-hydroxy-3-methylglutaryl-CoA synthase-like enzyme PksG
MMEHGMAMRPGIEDMNVYGGRAYVDVRELFELRGLSLARFDNLLMERKTVALPCEDPVSCAVNAARPILANMAEAERAAIEMLIIATESGIDFGKSLATYVLSYLGLSENCRVFEVKQACFAGTAALQMAYHYVAAGYSPGAKVLVVATDAARYAGELAYAEPSQGVGAVALLVGEHADVFELDAGAYGCCSREVMDGCRPAPDLETGDPDLSLLSYLECLERSFEAYCARVDNVSYLETFDYLAFHTPFAGMVKGAHQRMLRKHGMSQQAQIDEDFQRRVKPALGYCVQIGNVYSATVFVALFALLESEQRKDFARVGVFSYGSGCSSEFFSGRIAPGAAHKLTAHHVGAALSNRERLSMTDYERVLKLNGEVPFGSKDVEIDPRGFSQLYERCMAGRGLLALRRIKNFHREYVWT